MTIGEILSATGGQLLQGYEESIVTNICTDSRIVNMGDLFIPIVGEKFDGHQYIEDSIRAGAASVIVSNKQKIKDKYVNIIEVENSKRAYLDIASWYRKKFVIPFVGVVGSVGKTSTKDMIACALGNVERVLKTSGNFNNDIGVPKTILSIDKSHDVAIIEMGMNHKGEISRLTNVVRPNYVVISNIGVSHIENLGSKVNILRAKLEVLEGMQPNGVVFINNDDDMLNGVIDKIDFEVVTYGIKRDAKYRAENISDKGEDGVEFDVKVDGVTYRVCVDAVGMHNVYNALAAIAVSKKMGLDMSDIISGIKNFKPSKMRLKVEDRGGIKIINDSYNASPDSMRAAIDVLDNLSNNRRGIAVLGDMLELGDYAISEHANIGKYINDTNVSCVVAVGEKSRYIASELDDSKCVYSFDDKDKVIDFLDNYLKQGDVVLFKGSRGMHLEEIIDGIDCFGLEESN
ncbi:MAG: UDP-N-acetylmuramoyl-tripeptide--D-alanyl-D-alanine ligase [Clostridiales bacterium]|nr:UDP-N-acetylmuramoyl-tripeptide--D-alanyl-D-alanine ligase [Clostridiales bacterium]